MEIRVYDVNLNLKGIVENQTSFLWNRKYNGVGGFEGHFPITENNVALLAIGNLVSIKNAVDCGVIEYIKAEDKADNHELIVSGRFLTSYLDRRIINGTINFEGTVEDCMRRLVSEMSPIPNFILGERKGFSESVTTQISYKNVWEMEQKLAQSQNYGIRVRPDFTNKKMLFEVYKGKDHSCSQFTNHHVEFSERYGNVETSYFVDNCQLLKNVAVVSGGGEGESRVRVVVGDDTLVGLERRETHIDARDLQQEDGMTLEQYKEILRTRGREKLAECQRAKSFEATVIPSGNFKYLIHYDLGDIVTVRKDSWSLGDDLRITELTEIYEHGEMSVSPTFGTPLPISLNIEGE